jgi:hypothetical protein
MSYTVSVLKNAQQDVAEERHTNVIDVRVIDPVSGMPWTHYLDTGASTRYLRGQGIPITKQTLAHKRAMNTGPKWWFSGQRPITTKTELDRWIAEDLLREKSPLVGIARKRGRPRTEQAAASAAAFLQQEQLTSAPPSLPAPRAVAKRRAKPAKRVMRKRTAAKRKQARA